LNRQPPTAYHAYVLRCWNETSLKDHERPAWRFSLHDARTRRQRSFASLRDLLYFLENDLLNDNPDVPDTQI
jgi:hypothetical protein